MGNPGISVLKADEMAFIRFWKTRDFASQSISSIGIRSSSEGRRETFSRLGRKLKKFHSDPLTRRILSVRSRYAARDGRNRGTMTDDETALSLLIDQTIVHSVQGKRAGPAGEKKVTAG
jgi:hypothetical protein